MASEIGVQTIQHTNGTDAMTIDSSGRVLMPKIPCCFVQLTTSNSQDTSNPYEQEGSVIKFDKIVTNQGSCYSASTGNFTCPVAGVYEASTTIMTFNSGTENNQIHILKNSSTVASGYNSVDNQHVPMTASVILDCAANDTISVQHANGKIYIDANGFYSMFTVKLLG